MVKISKYLEPGLVTFLTVNSRDEAIQALVDLLDNANKLQDKKAFYEAIISRESIVTTGIGMGVAIPHAKLPGYHDFFIAIGILPQGVDWGALDSAPVRLVLMIGGPDDKQTEYLQILSNLTLAIKDEERRKKMLSLHESKEIIKLFQSF